MRRCKIEPVVFGVDEKECLDTCKVLVNMQLMSGPHQPSKDGSTGEYFLLTEFGVKAGRRLLCSV